ncbi:MAG: Response regulator UvrY [Syntrophorhabdus sp. PtaU1.Bin002]|nr:MAG: Response regulator UvrY [Syntrophorhabdus sp. PtaB.Bin006]OPY68648.1 MAG: Response regulator UvrY [Syntrophorhabdus sp. PtaU1.Bin002]
MLRVIITDDHPVVLKGLKEIISEGFDDVTIDVSSRGYELLSKISNNDYDIVLLDISLPDINGLEVLKEIRKKKRKLHVLVLSMYPEENYAARALKGGAQGYLTKASAPDELILAVRKILSGKKYISSVLAEQMMLDFESDTEKPPHENLSDRELQVLSMIGAGKAVKEIAEKLHLSANTVRTYRARILEKIGVRGTNELIHYAITHNLGEQ